MGAYHIQCRKNDNSSETGRIVTVKNLKTRSLNSTLRPLFNVLCAFRPHVQQKQRRAGGDYWLLICYANVATKAKCAYIATA